MAAQKRGLEEARASHQRYSDGASGHPGRRGFDEEREKHREVTLLQKDKEKEIEAIKV